MAAVQAPSRDRVIVLDKTKDRDVDFVRQAFGFEAERRGWFRERDRFFYFKDVIGRVELAELMAKPAPPSILEAPAPPLPEGPLSRPLFTMPDGTEVTWIRHPSAIPEECRPHWRHHTHLFVLNCPDLGYTAYTSIFGYAHLEGADGRYRLLAPGGIRWVNYPSHQAALSDALDMSLAVAMKIQVVGTPCAGNKIAVYGDYANLGPALRSIFAAYERLGLIATSADLGLSNLQMEDWALPVAPTCLVPLGVYRHGLPSALITSDAALAGLKAMAAALPGGPALGELTVSLQGLGEVGYRLAELVLAEGTRLIMTEADRETIGRFKATHPEEIDSGRAVFLADLGAIYDAQADLFVPCALRDILTKANLNRLKAAGVKMVGGPANNLFPDQVNGPWEYHRAGLPVVPYEGIGAGGVTGVAYSVMTGVLGKSPFTPQEKVDLIHDYVAMIMDWSAAYDLPAQVISDRVLFRRALRRRVMDQAKADAIVEKMRQAFAQGDPDFEQAVINDLTKRGYFYGPGRFPDGGWDWLADREN